MTQQLGREIRVLAAVPLFQEDILRKYLLSSVLSVGLAAASLSGVALVGSALTGTALADASIAGDWRADLGDGVAINMNVKPDGRWSSETIQNSKTVRRMRGNYKQTHDGQDAGKLIFTPTQTSNGKAQVETDQYKLSDNGGKLNLTADGDTMVFERRQK